MVKKLSNEPFDSLLLEGVIEVVAVDSKTGEFLYSFTPKVKDKYPQIFDELQNHLSRELMMLWQDGFISMDVTAENPLVSLTQKAFVEEEVEKLDDSLKFSLSEIKRITAID